MHDCRCFWGRYPRPVQHRIVEYGAPNSYTYSEFSSMRANCLEIDYRITAGRLFSLFHFLCFFSFLFPRVSSPLELSKLWTRAPSHGRALEDILEIGVMRSIIIPTKKVLRGCTQMEEGKTSPSLLGNCDYQEIYKRYSDVGCFFFFALASVDYLMTIMSLDKGMRASSTL